jgi:hypothetical protein
MMAKAAEMGFIESASSLSKRVDRVLTPSQQRVLELKDGESFLLQTTEVAEDNSIFPKWRYRSASQIAARLARWAQRDHVMVVYRVIDTNNVRVWRLGTV